MKSATYSSLAVALVVLVATLECSSDSHITAQTSERSITMGTPIIESAPSSSDLEGEIEAEGQGDDEEYYETFSGEPAPMVQIELVEPDTLTPNEVRDLMHTVRHEIAMEQCDTIASQTEDIKRLLELEDQQELTNE